MSHPQFPQYPGSPPQHSPAPGPGLAPASKATATVAGALGIIGGMFHISRLIDINTNALALDPGEFTAFIGSLLLGPLLMLGGILLLTRKNAGRGILACGALIAFAVWATLLILILAEETAYPALHEFDSQGTAIVMSTSALLGSAAMLVLTLVPTTGQWLQQMNYLTYGHPQGYGNPQNLPHQWPQSPDQAYPPQYYQQPNA